MKHHTSLTIRQPWLDLIISGDKKEEYREIKPFYDSRFKKYIDTKEVIVVTLINGYKKDSKRFDIKCTVTVGRGNPNWGAPTDRDVYILEIQT